MPTEGTFPTASSPVSGPASDVAPEPAREAAPSPATAPGELCINLCEIAPPGASPSELESLIADACTDAGFPHCGRIYVGSYFCENYFCALDERFHEAVRELCRRHGMGATLVVPVFGQATLDEGERRVGQALTAPGAYDEAVANDVARFLDMNERYAQRPGIGRLLSKVMRDARVGRLASGTAVPELSAEALECLSAAHGRGIEPVIELDPAAAVVDAGRVAEAAPGATIALHLPYCYATTGRNCTAASLHEPVKRKFRPGRPCELQCLGMRQAWRTDEGVPYVKHGRTFFFENPGCAIAGVPTWRIVYA